MGGALGAADPRTPSDRMAVTTYLDLDGRAVGIAAAGGAASAHLAQEAVDRWSSTLRTRRALIALPSPHCPADGSGGARIPVPRPSAAGRPGACRTPAATDDTIASYRERGDCVLLLDPRARGGRDGRAGRGPVRRGEVVEVGTLEAIGELAPEDEARVSFVVGACAVIDKVTPLLRALRERFPALRGQHPDQWCYSSTDMARTSKAVIEASDLTLCLGGAGHLPDLPVGIGRLRTVRSLADLSPEDVRGAATIGLIEADGPAGAGARAGLGVTDVLDVLAGIGPLSVVHHSVRTTVSTNVYQSPLTPVR
ncbi:hypothetical protein KSE_09180 [Kitasatospora setae KM-6054]|uniref:Uncharacterized protein n=1 Tax=Kitasatospora setae (strain ATCC 33774 / DSM 43861 / JCM 3304 / KCC A-0304 / NBRC 14216 / KM-6054) TaxID=452652 RepID=E4N6C4_KITSK|nr:hypothetical protein KSE_09180 [Kitasatospora setae KM-6054]